MKLTAILLLAIILISVFHQTQCASSEYPKMSIHDAKISQKSTDLQFNVVACAKSIYDLGYWGYEFYKAISTEDYAAVVDLIAEIDNLLAVFSTECLEEFFFK